MTITNQFSQLVLQYYATSCENCVLKDMKVIERAAIARVLIDLIKADKVIDSREMELYSNLKSKFSITRNDEIEAYSLTLSRAVNILKALDPCVISQLLTVFENMTVSDGFCAREEALLMLMLHCCLNSSELHCDVISNIIDEEWFDEKQILYIESHHDKEINFAISSNYRTITRELKLCGFDFVYLPQVVQHYMTTPKELLNKVVALLSPSLSEDAISALIKRIKLFKTDTFCIDQLHHKLKFEELDDTPPALLFRISRSKVDNNVVTNFLRIELKADVVATVQTVVDTFLSYNGSDRIDVSYKKDEKGRFLYNGFYRQMLELLLLQKSSMCHLLIDLVHGTISFPEIDLSLSGLHRKEKALYTLFVLEAHKGSINFSLPKTVRHVPKYNRRMEVLQQKYALIYAAFGGDPNKVPDITNPTIRLPMIARIKLAITKQSDKVYDAERLLIKRDKNKMYGISAPPDMFLYRDFKNPQPVSILDSPLYKSVSELN